jgi:hypothetical protein
VACKDPEPGTEDGGTLAAPTGLDTEVDGTTITFLWDAVKGADHYQISAGGQGDNDLVDTEVTYSGFASNQTFTWRVRAFDKDGNSSTWASASVTAGEGPLAGPTGLEFQNLTVDGVHLFFDVTSTTTDAILKAQGQFPGIDPKYITSTLPDGRQEITISQKTTGQMFEAGYWGFNLDGCLKPETDYTWQAAIIAGDKQSAWSDGPVFSTPEDVAWPSQYEALLGSYSATGVPSLLQSPGPSTWEGVTSKVAGVPAEIADYAFAIQNSFNSGNQSGRVFIKGGKFILDDMYPLATNVTLTNDAVVDVQLLITYLDDGKLIYASDADFGQMELTWDASTKKITFPKQYKNRDVVFFIAGINETNLYAMSEGYTNVALTIAPATRAAAATTTFSGTPVELNVPKAQVDFKKSSVMSTANVKAVKLNSLAK